MKYSIPFLSALFLFSALGCDSDEDGGGGGGQASTPSCEEDTRDEAYFAGITKTGEAGYSLTVLDSDHAPPAKGDNVWKVELKDATEMPLPGMTFKVNPTMPDHGHSSTAVAVITPEGEGIYTINPVNLFMPGYWEIEISPIDEGEAGIDDDVVLDKIVFKFCVEG